jgi:hypothetical protein
MPPGAEVGDADPMSILDAFEPQPTAAAAARDPANELYDRACDLLAAANELRPAAGRPGAAPAIAATLGCIEAALEAVADASAAMRAEVGRQLARDEAGTAELASGVSRHAAERQLSELVDVLANAHRAADTTRARIGPLLAQLTLPRS